MFRLSFILASIFLFHQKSRWQSILLLTNQMQHRSSSLRRHFGRGHITKGSGVRTIVIISSYQEEHCTRIKISPKVPGDTRWHNQVAVGSLLAAHVMWRRWPSDYNYEQAIRQNQKQKANGHQKSTSNTPALVVSFYYFPSLHFTS
jgi:hypothetical protein